MSIAVWGLFGSLMLVTAIIAVPGFRRPVAFFNLVYPFSVLAMSVVVGVAHAATLCLADVVHLLLLGVWGVRLGLFVLHRERLRSYRDHQQRAGYTEIPMAVRPALWLMVVLLYPAMVSPVLMAAGLMLEALADAQKSAAKARAPLAPVTTGLFGWVRCPNYLGEIAFWFGNLIAGLAFVSSPARGVVAVGGCAALVFIMLGATKRLEHQQELRYGDDAGHRSWVRRVPILFPWPRVHSFRRLRVPGL